MPNEQMQILLNKAKDLGKVLKAFYFAKVKISSPNFEALYPNLYSWEYNISMTKTEIPLYTLSTSEFLLEEYEI